MFASVVLCRRSNLGARKNVFGGWAFPDSPGASLVLIVPQRHARCQLVLPTLSSVFPECVLVVPVCCLAVFWLVLGISGYCRLSLDVSYVSSRHLVKNNSRVFLFWFSVVV